MKKTTLILLCGMMLVGVFSMALPARAAYADVAAATADKDGYVWESLGDYNDAKIDFLYVGNFTGTHQASYIGFTFSKPATAWTKAEIRLTLLSVGADFIIYVDKVTGPWNETGMQGNLTWNNQPAIGEFITTLFPLKSMPYATVLTVDVTDLMSSLTNNISICLSVITLTVAGECVFFSREDDTAANRPVLVFANTVPDVPGIAGYDVAFLGLVAFGMVFFLGKKIMSKRAPK